MQSKLCLYSAKRKGQTYLAKQMYHDPDGIYWTFFKRVWERVQILMLGAILAPGQRTVDRYSAHYGFEQ